MTYSYDAIDRPTAVNDSVGGNISWAYDVVSQHPRVAETTGNGTVTVEYDEIGRRLKLSATGQTDVTYTYDKNSRLKTVTQGTTTVTLNYDDAGRRTTLAYPNGVVTSYGYDDANRVETIVHVTTPTTIESLTYQNDPAGNRTKLTRANAAASLIPTAVTADYDVANEQIKFNSPTVNLVYDNNGNLTSFTDASGTTTYMWNARNQMTAISGPGLSATFNYDGLGRRVSKTINGTTTGYWYDEEDLLAELNGSSPTATYVRSLEIDEPFIRQSATNEFYHADALGSTVTISDAAGAAQTTYHFGPFGSISVTGTSTNFFQYAGREFDGTGLFYYRARYYHPRLQRFASEDPYNFSSLRIGTSFESVDSHIQIALFLGEPVRHNPYSYAGNSPTRYVDPLGLLFGCSFNGGEEFGEFATQYWSDLAFQTGNPLYNIPGLLGSLWTRKTSDATLTTLGLAYNLGLWYKYGTEIPLPFGKNFRIAPFGNRTGHRYGELPHYHRTITDSTGKTVPGGSKDWHRPWEKGW